MADDPRGKDSADFPDEQTSISIGKAIWIAREYHRQAVFGIAEEIYLQILEQKRDQPEVLNYLGVLRFQIGFPEDGIRFILAALEIDPNYVDALNNLGNILRKQNQLEVAEKMYRRAIDVAPDFCEAHMNLAALMYSSDRYEEALIQARLVEQHSPQMFDAGEIAANSIEINSLKLSSDFAGAAKSYLKVMERRTFDANVHQNLARILCNLNRRDEAVEAYRRWVEMEPDNPEPQHHRAACTGIDVPTRASDGYVKELFDRFANSFDKQLTRLEYAAPARIVEEIQEIFGAPEPKLNILDAGCGTGLCGVLVRPFAKRLVGIDLSPKMLEKARGREIYDDLQLAELTAFLVNSSEGYDAIVSADTLIYFGDLIDVMQAASVALGPSGYFVFTVEKSDSRNIPEGYLLQTHGRYQHSEQYVKSSIERAELELVTCREVHLRLENGKPVPGWLVAARRGSIRPNPKC